MSDDGINDDLQSNDNLGDFHPNDGYSDYHDTRGHIEAAVTIFDYTSNNDNNSASYDKRSNDGVKRNSSFGLPDNYELCLICDKKIYPMDKLNADGKLYHKNCFRCSKCRTILSITNFSVNNNSIYCKTHFMELFKMRGKFDDDADISHEIVSGDITDSEAIPTTDTKGLLAKFRELECGGGFTPQPFNVGRRNSNQRSGQQADVDIIRYDDLPPDELPPPETAKAMVAKFKAMESNQNVPSPVCVQKMQQKAKANSTPNANVRLQLNNAHVSVNEDDYNKEELPEEGTTKNLLSIFQQISESN